MENYIKTDTSESKFVINKDEEMQLKVVVRIEAMGKGIETVTKLLNDNMQKIIDGEAI